jgi:hypothetical protein
MPIRKPDLCLTLPDAWTRVDDVSDVETALTFVPTPREAGALQLSMPMGIELAPSPAEQLEAFCLSSQWGRPAAIEPFDSAIGPACMARAPADAHVDALWAFQPPGCPIVIASWVGEPQLLDAAAGILARATCGVVMRHELWLLAAITNMISALELGEDLVPHALFVSGAHQNQHVLAGTLDELEMLADYLRHEAQSKPVDFVSLCGESRRRYGNGQTLDVVTIYIESPDSVRQYEIRTDASVAPRRIGKLELVAPNGWGPFVDLFHRTPVAANVEAIQRLSDAT